MRDEWTDRLSEYLDDELTAHERSAVAAHVATCPECARALDELKEVVEAAHGLPARPPARDLWSGVAERIASTPAGGAGTNHFVSTAAAASFRARAARRVSFTLPQLAAASLLLAAVSGGLMWTLRGAPDALPRQTASAVDGSHTGGSGDADPRLSPDAAMPQTMVAPVGLADAQYDAAVTDLEKALQHGRNRLDPATVAIVEQNLQIIDRAIAQAREALESDPANSYLSSHLVETRRKKLDLLRRATALTTASD
jgi:anti-sigma factor RsiW